MDKRPRYIYFFGLLASIFPYLFELKSRLYDGAYGIKIWITLLPTFFYFLFVSLIITSLPIFLSGKKLKGRNYFGYGIPLLILLLSLWHSYTCNGKFCNLADGLIFIPGSLIFIVFLTLGIVLRRVSIKVILAMMWIEIILLAGLFSYNVYHSYISSNVVDKINSLSASLQNSSSLSEIIKICDSVPIDSTYVKYKSYDQFRYNCWQKALKLNPDINACAQSKTDVSKKKCIFVESQLNGLICERGSVEDARKLQNDPTENQRLASCWRSRANIFPDAYFCQYEYDWNMEKCRDVVGFRSLN